MRGKGPENRSAGEHAENRRAEVNVLRRCIASRTRGKGAKGPEKQAPRQAVTKDERASERESAW